MRKLFVLVAVGLGLLASFVDASELFTKTYASSSPERVEGATAVLGPTLSVDPMNFNLGVLFHPKVEAFRAKKFGATVELNVDLEPEMVPAQMVEFQVDGMFYKAILSHAEIRSSSGRTDYSWSGYVQGSQFTTHFNVDGSGVAGEIYLPMSAPNGFHRSITTHDGTTFLVQWNEKVISQSLVNDQVKQLAIDAVINIEGPQLVGPPRRRFSRDETVIDLLYVYDTTSLACFGGSPEQALDGLKAQLRNAVDAINGTITDSKPVGKYRVRLVGMVPAPGNYTSKGEPFEDLCWLSSSTEVGALRNQADVVGLWVGVSNSYSGLAIEYTGDSRSAFHVICVSGGALVATHEFGHLLGMNHQPEFAPVPDQVPFSFAYGHYVNGIFADAMSYYSSRLCPNDCPAIPVYSCPHVLVDGGVPTGILNERENWRTIDITFPIVSKFR